MIKSRGRSAAAFYLFALFLCEKQKGEGEEKKHRKNSRRGRCGHRRQKCMVVLIGGVSHAGKTLLAQRLLEKYQFPYTSIDHIKMGLIRGYAGCGFTALDSDAAISRALWGMLKGMVDTCLENRQHIILEGCYLPPEQVRKYSRADVAAVYLAFSEAYIRARFDRIIGYENVIETRKSPGDLQLEPFIADNAALRKACADAGMPCFVVQDDYEQTLEKAFLYLGGRIAAANGATSISKKMDIHPGI